MATPTATAFTVADFLGAQIQARIDDDTFDDAVVSVSEELISDAADCPDAEGVIVRVVPTDQGVNRTDRAQSLEDRPIVVIQVCFANREPMTQAKRRRCGNLAVQILRYFKHRDRTELPTLDATLVDAESEVVTLFEDDIFRTIGVAMAAITLTYRQQNATV